MPLSRPDPAMPSDLPVVTDAGPQRIPARGAIFLKDAPLARVMIRCSVTNRPVATGMHVDATTWDARPLGYNRGACPGCKQTHAWGKSDAWLEVPKTLS
jgi:hypothetical protein